MCVCVREADFASAVLSFFFSLFAVESVSQTEHTVALFFWLFAFMLTNAQISLKKGLCLCAKYFQGVFSPPIST